MSPREFIESCYPSVGFASGPDQDEDEARLAIARRGEYWGERKSYPKPDIETLSATARIERQNERIERMLRYVIARLPEPKKDAASQGGGS